MTELAGGCHCGAIGLELALPVAPEEVPVWLCTCTFCRRHGARSIFDARGRVRFSAREPEQVELYRFAQRAVDFVLCRRCGVYLGVVLKDKDGAWAAVNSNVLDQAERFLGRDQYVTLPDEPPEARAARRKRVWTPAELALG